MPAGGTYSVQYINDNNIRWRDVFFWNTCLTVIIMFFSVIWIENIREL